MDALKMESSSFVIEVSRDVLRRPGFVKCMTARFRCAMSYLFDCV